MIRESSLSSVLLPAPFRPMIPTTSPGATVKFTLRRAQSTSRCGFARLRLPKHRQRAARALRNAVAQALVALLLGTKSILLANVLRVYREFSHAGFLDEVSERFFHASEVIGPTHEQREGHTG